MGTDALIERREIEQAWKVQPDGSRRNGITGELQSPPERAPVQGYGRGIPWALHLDAYDAYCAKYGRQVALIDWHGRGCRGGFGTEELDDFIPGWRDKVSEMGRLRAENATLLARIEAAEKALAPFAALAKEFDLVAVVEICEPDPDNPSPHIKPFSTDHFRAAAQWQAGQEGEG